MLDFSDNFLKEIPNVLLRSTQILKTISLANNQLAELPGDVFYGLSQLEIIDISNNILRSVHRLLFRGMAFSLFQSSTFLRFLQIYINFQIFTSFCFPFLFTLFRFFSYDKIARLRELIRAILSVNNYLSGVFHP